MGVKSIRNTRHNPVHVFWKWKAILHAYIGNNIPLVARTKSHKFGGCSTAEKCGWETERRAGVTSNENDWEQAEAEQN